MSPAAWKQPWINVTGQTLRLTGGGSKVYETAPCARRLAGTLCLWDQAEAQRQGKTTEESLSRSLALQTNTGEAMLSNRQYR
jgi:hypothetical protein